MFEDAESYGRFMGRWSRLVAEPIVQFANLPEQGRILDVGSGTGSLAFSIAERYPRLRITGIDPSSEYVAYAAEKNPYKDRVGFAAGDAQRLDFDDATFDAAISLLVFSFIPDPKRALSELRRITRPGGKIVAAVWDYDGGMRMLRTFWDAAVKIDPSAQSKDERHMPLCRRGELSALWKEGGLVEVVEQPIDIRMHFESFHDFWEPFLLGQGPAGAYARGLVREKLEGLRDEVKGHLPLSSDDAPFTITARAWAVRGIVPKRTIPRKNSGVA